MKIIWITNILLHKAASIISGKTLTIASGGWLEASAKALVESGNIELTVISVSPIVKQITVIDIDNVTHIIFLICYFIFLFNFFINKIIFLL